MEKERAKDNRKAVEPHEWLWSILGTVAFVALGAYALMTAPGSS